MTRAEPDATTATPGSAALTVVGRAEARTTLEGALDRARGGRAAVVLVDGPPGFGKTTIIAHVVSGASVPTLLRATGEQDEQTIGFGVLGQLVRRWPGRLPPRLQAISGGGGVESDPLAVGVELLSLLDELAPGDLAALIVDDAQWADAPSLRALSFALRRAWGASLLVVLACRSDGVDGLPSGLSRLVAEDGARITLDPFGGAEVREMARAGGGGDLTNRAAERIADHAGGSPLHIRAILDELRRTGSAPRPDLPLPVPSSYAHLVAARLRDCPVSTADLVAAASIMAVARPLELVSAVARTPDPSAAVDAAVAADLLQRPGPDHRVRFVHPLTRLAVYQGMPSAQRSALHTRAAELLAPIDEAAALRHRASAVSGADPELAAQMWDRARSDLTRGDGTAAAAWLRAAIRLAAVDGAEADTYLLELVETVIATADVAAEPELRASIGQRPTSPLREYLLARLDTVIGDLRSARERAQSAWDLATAAGESSDNELRARIAAELARTGLTTGHALEAIRWAQQALALAPPGFAATADAPGTLLLATAARGDTRAALASLSALPAFIEEPDGAQLDAMIARGVLSKWTDDLPQARTDLESAVRVTRRNGPVHLTLGASAYLSDVAYRVGDWDSAITEAETGIALAYDLDHVRTLPMLHAAAATPHAARGHFAAAAEHVEAALRHAEAVGDMQSHLWSRAAGGRLARAQHDPPGVVDMLEPLAAMTDLDGLREPGLQPWQALYAWGLVELDRLEDAARVLDDAEACAVERRQSAVRVSVTVVRAALGARRGRAQEGYAVLEDARGLRESITDRPFETAQFDLSAGSLARRCGERRSAAADLRRASDALTALQAHPWLTTAREELERCGIARRPRGGSSTDLTAAEATVVKYVVAGMTNREIAGQLTLSVKTVEYHLSNVYAKTGVRSRTQLTAWRLRRDQPDRSPTP